MSNIKKAFDLDAEVKRRVFEKRNGPKKYEEKKKIKPSDLSSDCYRKLYYSYHRVKVDYPMPIENIEAADAGDAFHAMYRKQLTDAGLLIPNVDKKTGKTPLNFIDKETPDPEYPVVNPELGITWAKCDGIIKVPYGDQAGLWVLEIKSKKQEKFRFVKGPEKDLRQGMLYVFEVEERLKRGDYDHIPQLAGETEIRGVCFVYISRGGDHDKKVYWEPKSEAVMTDVIERCVTLLDYVEREELPPKTQDFCNWCNWRDKCSREFKV